MSVRRAVLHAGGIALALALAGCAPRARAVFEPDAIPEAYARSTAALGWPGATRAFQILPAGDLTNGDWMVRLRPSGAGAPAAPPRVIAFEERRLPIAGWTRRAGDVRWDFEAFACPESDVPAAAYAGAIPAPRDSGLLVALEARATNLGTAPADAGLEIALTDLDRTVPFVAFDAPETLGGTLRFGGASSPEPAHAWCSVPAQGARATVAWRLEPGRSRNLRCVLPAYPTPGKALETFARTPHARRANRIREHWRAELRRGIALELGDPDVERAFDAALGVLLVCRERRGPAWVPIGSPLHYRDVWLRDGARAIAALAMAGRTDVARDLAAGFLPFQWPQGAFLSQRGQLDGTGQALWAFEQALLRPAPAESLGVFADAALAAVRWCERQRALGRQSALPFGEMLPFGDPRDNEVTTAQLVGNDAWAIAGYRAAARLLRAAGRGAAADTVLAERARYVQDFDAALSRTGAMDVPPSWQGDGLDWGNLAAATPCGALSPADARVAAMAARVWGAAGGAGLATYAVRDSLHYYLGADLGTWALLAGRRAQADSVLAAMLAWRSASGGAAEILSRTTRDFGPNVPPHATSAATLVALLRTCLVHDDDDTLRLTLGARESWWRNGRVGNAPTRFGKIDLAFSRTAGEATWSWTAVPVWTALTLPPGTTIQGGPPPPLQAGSRADVVLAPPGTTRARVALAAESTP